MTEYVASFNFLYIFDLIGTFAFAISGAMVGVEKKMDIYGMFVLALVTGVGGGTLRDMMLDRTPPFMFNDFNYLLLVIVATVLVFFLYPHVQKRLKLLNIFDAIGLGVFTLIGANIALANNISWYGIVLFGVMTATVGGMIRDILAQEVPFVLKKEVYASASIAGGLLFLFLNNKLHINMTINILLTSAFITIIRVIAIYKKWNLPKMFSKNGEGEQ